MKVTRVLEVDVQNCRECPYFGLDGGPGAVMVCNHPEAPDQGYIVSWREIELNKIPDKCPIK